MKKSIYTATRPFPPFGRPCVGISISTTAVAHIPRLTEKQQRYAADGDANIDTVGDGDTGAYAAGNTRAIDDAAADDQEEIGAGAEQGEKMCARDNQELLPEMHERLRVQNARSIVLTRRSVLNEIAVAQAAIFAWIDRHALFENALKMTLVGETQPLRDFRER